MLDEVDHAISPTQKKVAILPIDMEFQTFVSTLWVERT